MYSGMGTRALPRAGFPIRKSRDQRLVSTYSGLIAAAHVLLRLLAPRHPPCALSLLIVKNTLNVAMEFSRCTRIQNAPYREKPAQWPVSQNSAASENADVEVDVVSKVISLERRGCSRSFRYGYLVTTSPQSPIPPSAAPSLAG